MSERDTSAALRRLVAERGRHCCEYCRTQARYSADTLAIAVLQLNRPGLVNLRRVLYAIGEHPPRANTAS